MLLDWLFGGPPYQNLDDDSQSVQSRDMNFLQYSTCGAMTTAAGCPGVAATTLSRQPSRTTPTTLQDIENAAVWRQYQQQTSLRKGMVPSHSTISKLSHSTSPSSDNNSTNNSLADDASIVDKREHALQDWDAYKRQQMQDGRRSRCRILAYVLLCLLVVGSIALGVGLAMQKKKHAKGSSSSSSINQGDETANADGGGGGVFEQTFEPDAEEEEDFGIGNGQGNTDLEDDQNMQLTESPTQAAFPLEDAPVAIPPELMYQDDMGENGYDYTADTDYLVGVYYYPWHGSNFHNGDGYLRKELIPAHQPALGEYDDSRPDVIAQHMRWFRKANIGLLVTSWWGPDRVEDSNTKDVIMEHEDVGNLKIALHYETTGRIKGSDMSTARSDIQYMCEHYFDHPNYYHINDRPVLVIYITRSLHDDGLLEGALLTMRSEASKCGHNLYLIGDQVFASAPNPDEPFVPFWYFDAVTNYDVYGSAGRPSPYANRTAVDAYYGEQEKWRQQALQENCRFIPPVSPGYNDRAVRLDNNNPPLSRRLSATDEEGSLFWYQLKKALPLVDPEVDNMILVNSFNEWHEDTVSSLNHIDANYRKVSMSHTFMSCCSSKLSQ
jgi:Glycosyl hydrolase family 99